MCSRRSARRNNSSRRYIISMRLFRIFKEIENYMFLLRTIRANRGTVEWEKFKLRTNWFGSIGTVINLPPDVFQGESMYYKIYVIEETKPINRYLESLNLQEIVTLRAKSLVKPENGEYAYLVTYEPLFRELTFWYVLTRSALLGGAVWIEAKFGLVGKAIDLVTALVQNSGIL